MRTISRPNRARVTVEIQNQLLILLKREKDFNKKKRHPANWYRDEVGKNLGLPEKDNPLRRSYEDYIKRLKSRLHVPDPLGEPWTIGLCEKNGISDSAIPTLIEFQNICNDLNKDLKFPEVWKWELSVRKAKWMAKLFPAVDAVAKKYFAKQTKKRIIVLSKIADIYSKKEFDAEIIDKSDANDFTFNTGKIDRLVFYEPHSTLKQWLKNIARADIDLKDKIEMINKVIGKT